MAWRLASEDVEIGQHIADTYPKEVADRTSDRQRKWFDSWASHILISANTPGKFTETSSAALKSD